MLVTVNTAYKIHEAEYLLRQSDTHTLVMIDGYKDSDYVGIIKELCPELETATPRASRCTCSRLPFLRNIITVDSEQPGCLHLGGGHGAGRAMCPWRRSTAGPPPSTSTTSATCSTPPAPPGFPKGVMLTHYNVVNNGKAIGDCMDLSTADRMMIQVPMFHCFGMVLAMTASMTHGVTMSPHARISPPRPALACINQEQITCFHGVPTMFIAMLEHEDFDKTDFSLHAHRHHGRLPLPDRRSCRTWSDKMHMSEICITYGQTEAVPGHHHEQDHDDSIEVRGQHRGPRHLPAWSARSSTPRPARSCRTTWTASSCARGYNIMKGYYKMPSGHRRRH